MSDINNTNVLSLHPDVVLLKGQRVIRVGDKFIPVGVGGNFMPGTGSMPTKYYKCQAVDTTTKTWSGFEAEDKGTYFTFSDIPTTGLSYIGYAPTVGEIYSEDGRLRLAELFNGVVENTDTGEAAVFLAEGTTVSNTVAVIPVGRVEDGVYNL